MTPYEPMPPLLLRGDMHERLARFAGSGATLEAAHLERLESVGIELTPEYWPLIEARIARLKR